MIPSKFWTPQFINKHIPYNLHWYFLSISISFLYLLSRSVRNKRNKNATGTGFEVEDIMQFMDFRVSEYALGS